MGPSGRRTLLAEGDFRAWQEAHQPPPPPIQAHIREAYALRERLESTAGLSQGTLASELGISRFGLIQTLSLTRLSPEIQRFIQALPPGLGERKVAGILSKEFLAELAGIQDTDEQDRRFEAWLMRRGRFLMAFWRPQAG